MVIVLIALFLIGLGLSLTGGIIGIVQAFQTSVVWGLLYLFVPFASLVFAIKFWGRKWVRNSFLLSLGGVAAWIAAAVLSSVILQQLDSNVFLEGVNWEEGTLEDGESSDSEFSDGMFL